MERRAEGLTIRDVARHAKVGVGTVSRVLNDSPLVSEETRRRVQCTIEELGYRRSATARALSLGRTQTVGVVLPFVTSLSVHERLRGVIERLADEGDYDLLLFDATTVKQRADAFSEFARKDRVDGVLIVSLQPSDDEVAQLQREGLPAVLVDARHPALPSVAIDNVHGGALAAEHLLERGHVRVGFIGDAPSPLGFSSSELRCRGFERRLAQAGIEGGRCSRSASTAVPRHGPSRRRCCAPAAPDGDLRGLRPAGDGGARGGTQPRAARARGRRRDRLRRHRGRLGAAAHDRSPAAARDRPARHRAPARDAPRRAARADGGARAAVGRRPRDDLSAPECPHERDRRRLGVRRRQGGPARKPVRAFAMSERRWRAPEPGSRKRARSGSIRGDRR